jgi:hypothetical protein
LTLGSGSVLKLYFHQFAVFFRHFEERPRFQCHEAGYEDFRDLADAGVVEDAII